MASNHAERTVSSFEQVPTVPSRSEAEREDVGEGLTTRFDCDNRTDPDVNHLPDCGLATSTGVPSQPTAGSLLDQPRRREADPADRTNLGKEEEVRPSAASPPRRSEGFARSIWTPGDVLKEWQTLQRLAAGVPEAPRSTLI